VSVCISVREHTPRTTSLIPTNVLVHFTYGRGLVLLGSVRIRHVLPV